MVSFLDLIDFCQCVYKFTHCLNHILDLALIINGITEVFPHYLFLSDHYLIAFELLTLKYMVKGKHFYSRG